MKINYKAIIEVGIVVVLLMLIVIFLSLDTWQKDIQRERLETVERKLDSLINSYE